MISLLWARLRKRKAIMVIPIFIIGIFVPIMCHYFSVRYVEEPERIVEEIIALLHTCIPMAGCWWIILLYQDFFVWEGNELLYYYHSWRQLIKEYIFVMAVYAGISGFIAFCIQQTIDFPLFVIGQLSVETVFIASLTLFSSFLLQNTGGSLLIVIAYCVYLNHFDSLGIFQFMSVFPRREEFLNFNVGLLRNALISSGIMSALGSECIGWRRGYK